MEHPNSVFSAILAGMSELSDTHPTVQRMLIERLHQMPGWRKMELLEDMNRMARMVALSGLRQRYPDASEAELHRRLAELLLGKELGDKIYGPMIEENNGR